MTDPEPVLVIGGTGNLGGRVVDALPARGITVRALIRDGTDPEGLRARGVVVRSGDVLDPASLRAALEGVRAVVTTAIGYLGRRTGDTLASVDDLGNRNLADAAHAVGTPLLVFTSILAADQAATVPHFHKKAVIERYLIGVGVPLRRFASGDVLGRPGHVEEGSLKDGCAPSAGLVCHGPTHTRTTSPTSLLQRSMNPAPPADDPAGVGRREVHVEPRVSLQSLADGGVLMGSVVVADQVGVKIVGDLGVDLDQELLELGAAVAPVQAGDHAAVGDVERGEQAGRAVPDVVVRPLLWHAGHHRERRLGMGQRLHLALLIHAQHNRGLGRVRATVGRCGVGVRGRWPARTGSRQ